MTVIKIGEELTNEDSLSQRNSMSKGQIEKERDWQVYETESNVSQIALELRGETHTWKALCTLLEY